MKNILIQAINISGLGSSIWACDIISTFKMFKKNNNKLIFFNEKMDLKNSCYFNYKCKIKNNFFFKIYNVIKIYYFNNIDTLIFSLGDYPLPFIRNQILFINQANIILPRINKYSSKSFMFFIKRIYFNTFINDVQKIYVQSLHMKYSLLKSYKIIPKKIKILKPSIKQCKSKFSKKTNLNEIKILYPANHYSHKNHKIIIDLLEQKKLSNIFFYFTSTKKESKIYKKYKNLRYINYFDHQNVYKIFNKFDAIIYPSLLESYGLPLSEAKIFKIPVIAPNLPYAKEIMKDKALYFDVNSVHSLNKTIKKLLKNY